MERIHKAAKAGSWYPANPAQLESLLNEFLAAAAATLHNTSSSVPCISAIVPHAGMLYSGGCAATSYKLLAESHNNPKTVIIFGAVHTCYLNKPGIYSTGEWETPLGNLPIDNELAERLLTTGLAEENYDCHNGDNSIELQTPFIKHLFPESMILPIATPASITSIKLGKELAAIVKKSPDNYLVIGSSDLTHYGSAYGFAPAGTGKTGNDWARENDQRLLKLIIDMKAEEIIPEVAEHKNACGAGAIAAILSYSQQLNVTKGHLLQHVLSTDIHNDGNYDLSVGYASIIF